MIQYDQYVIDNDKNFPAMKRVRNDGQPGPVVEALQGLYTTVQQAMNAVDSYRNKQKSEANANKEKPAVRGKQLREGVDNGSKPAEVPVGRDDGGAELHAKQGRVETAA